MIGPLFIGQRLDGVVPGGAKAGVERPEGGPDQGDHAGDGPPVRHDHHRNRGRLDRPDEPARAEAHQNPENGATDPQNHGFRQDDPQNEDLRRAERFQNADLARPLQHRHVHREANHGESDDDPDRHDDDDEFAQSRNVVHVIQGCELGHRVDRVIWQLFLQAFNHGGGVGRIVEFQINVADLADVAGLLLQHAQRKHDMGQLAAFNDAAPPPWGVEDDNPVPYMRALLVRVELVDDDVARTLKGTSVKEGEAPAHPVELLQVDAGRSQRDALDRLIDGAHGQLDVRLFPQPIHNFVGDPAAQSQECGSRRTDDHVGADAARAPLAIFQEAVAQAHQTEDEGHGHADEQDAEQAAHGFVLEVFQNELGGHFLRFLLSTRRRWPGRSRRGRRRLADYLQRSPFRLVEHKLIIRYALVDVHLHDIDHHGVLVVRAVDFDVLRENQVIVGPPLGIARVGENVAGRVENQLARYGEVVAVEPDGPIELQLSAAVHVDHVKDIERIVLVGEVLQQELVAIGIHRPHQQCLQKVLGAQVFQLVLGGLIDFVAAYQETVPGGDVKFEVRAVRYHVESLVPHHGVEADQADTAGFSKENVRANVLVLGDLAFLRAAERRHHVHGSVEIVNGFVLSRHDVDQRGPVRDEQRLGWLSAGAGEGTAPRQAGRKPKRDQAEHENGDGDAPEEHRFIVGSRLTDVSIQSARPSMIKWRIVLSTMGLWRSWERASMAWKRS